MPVFGTPSLVQKEAMPVIGRLKCYLHEASEKVSDLNKTYDMKGKKIIITEFKIVSRIMNISLIQISVLLLDQKDQLSAAFSRSRRGVKVKRNFRI
jgi:hypothetical protein